MDIDADELKKENLHPDMSICSDATEFFKRIINKNISNLNIDQWQNECKDIFNKQRLVLDKHVENKNFVSNYVLIDKLSDLNNGKIPIITSDGSANVVTMHALRLKVSKTFHKHWVCIYGIWLTSRNRCLFCKQ